MATLVHDRMVVAAPQARAGSNLVERLKAILASWAQRIEERDALARFTWRDMKDIAISEADIAREVGKPFWRA